MESKQQLALRREALKRANHALAARARTFWLISALIWPRKKSISNGLLITESQPAARARSRSFGRMCAVKAITGMSRVAGSDFSRRVVSQPSIRGITTLTNGTNTQLTFGLENTAPPGWTVDARPSGESQAATAVVDAGSDATINVTVEPPAAAAAGTYDILVRAVSGEIVAEAPLQVEITGSFSMSLDTSDGPTFQAFLDGLR